MKIYGPYTRKDRRKHIVIRNDDGSKTSKSYPKYLIELKLGRELKDNETVDHIDDDFTNDNLDNLQVLSRPKNSAKYFDDNPHKKAQYIELTCAYRFCGKTFSRELRLYRKGLKQNLNKDVFFCSRNCQGKVFH